jgi:hypothetical protein
MVRSNLQKNINMKETGKKICSLGKESLLGQMEKFMKVYFLKVKRRDKDNLIMKMEMSTKEIGKMT